MMLRDTEFNQIEGNQSEFNHKDKDRMWMDELSANNKTVIEIVLIFSSALHRGSFDPDVSAVVQTQALVRDNCSLLLLHCYNQDFLGAIFD